jgi:hypothetical protein
LKKGRKGDGGGLYIQVISNSKLWIYRYHNRNEPGKTRYMSLGSYPLVSLQEARGKATQCRRQFRIDNLDPIAECDKLRATDKKRQSETFLEATESFIAAQQKRSDDHKQKWDQIIKKYVPTPIMPLPVADIAGAHIRQILNPVWKICPETANRLRQKLERILDRAN